MTLLATIFGKIIEVLAAALLVALAVVVVMAVFYRYVLNDSLAWYDEVASVMLAWITYFGAALAAQRRAHLGFSALLLALPLRPRIAAFAVAEAVTYAVFVVLAIMGWRVLEYMEGMNLEGLPWVSFQFVQSIVPIGCTLIVLAQLFSTPLAWRRLIEGSDAESEEIAAEIAKAEAELAHSDRDRVR